MRLDRLQTPAQARHPRSAGGRPLGCGPSRAFGLIGDRPGSLATPGRESLPVAGRDDGGDRLGMDGLGRRPFPVGPGRPFELIRRAAHGLGGAPAGRLEFRDPGGLGSTERRHPLAVRLVGRAHDGDLLERLGEGAFRLGHRGLQVRVRGRNGHGRLASSAGQVRLRGEALRPEPLAVADHGSLVGGQPSVTQLKLGVRRLSDLMGRPSGALHLDPRSERGGDRGRSTFGIGQLRGRQLDVGPGTTEPREGIGPPDRRLMPAGMGRDDQRSGQVVAGRCPTDLLLRLDREPSGLRPELGEDVFHSARFASASVS